MTRRLGPLTVSDLGLGCMGMSTTYGRPDADAARATLLAALDEGVTLFDTAEMYGNGHNERFVGEVLGHRREEVVLASKTGIRTLPGLGLPIGVDGRPKTVRAAIDGSLQRLGTDVIDLYYLHRVDPRVPVAETIGAMSEAVQAGKIRHLGISEATAADLRSAHATHPLAALQIEWSLFSRDLESEVISVGRDLGIGLVAYSPLGRGMLTGAPSGTTDLALVDYRRFLPRWRRRNLAENLRQVGVVQQIAAELDATAGQVALAWVLRQGADVVPIPGTTKVRHLRSNLGAAALELTEDQMRRLDQLRPSGSRYDSGTGVPRA